MTKHTWLPSDIQTAMASEIDQLVEDQTFLEQFFAATRLMHELGRGLDDESVAS